MWADSQRPKVLRGPLGPSRAARLSCCSGAESSGMGRWAGKARWSHRVGSGQWSRSEGLSFRHRSLRLFQRWRPSVGAALGFRKHRLPVRGGPEQRRAGAGRVRRGRPELW